MGGTGASTRRPLVRAEAEAREGAVTSSDKWGKPVTLGTAVLPADVDLGKLESLLFQVLVFFLASRIVSSGECG